MIYKLIITMLSLVFVTCHPVTSLGQQANRDVGNDIAVYICEISITQQL